MASKYLTDSQKTIHEMDRKAGEALTRIAVLAALADCCLDHPSPRAVIHAATALNTIKIIADEVANDINCLAEAAGAAWPESHYAGL
jgi:hypothetical protein